MELVRIATTIEVSTIALAKELNINYTYLSNVCVDIWGSTPEYMTMYDLLTLMIQPEIDHEIINPGKLFKVIDKIELLLDEKQIMTMTTMRMLAVTELALQSQAKHNEYGRVHSWFKKNHKDLIPGSKLVKVKAIDRKRPDFTVEVKDVIYPVECKLNFGVSGLKQLQGYMRLWGVDKGYAIAPKLSCKIPDNIIFIECK